MSPGDVIIQLEGPAPANDGQCGRLSGREHAELASDIASITRRTLPDGVGCLVITYDYARGGHLGYASTGDRSHCIALLTEFLTMMNGGRG
jgi:hypothetical protein